MKKLLLVLTVSMLSVISVIAQRNVTGRVTDENGNAVAGASVTVKETGVGVSTGASGSFSVPVDAKGKTLVFSYVGKMTEEITIGSQSVVNISLRQGTRAIDEVVVVAYGSKRTRDNVGSISKVTADKIASLPVPSFDQALAGRAAGVQVNNSSGLLADGVNIRIRGANSISNSAQPLFVVDGVPMSTATNLNQFDGNSGIRYNPLVDINPADIESIEVLKDAGAAVLYGSRAANGVILITTKRGKAGKVNLAYNGYFGFTKPTKLLDLLNGAEFIEITNEKALNRFGSASPNAVLAATNDINSDGVPDETDWQREALDHSGFLHNHQLSISGGTDKTSYYGSVDYTDQEGFALKNRLKRGSIRLNFDVTPRTWIKVGMGLNYSKTFNDGVQSNGLLAGSTVSALNAPPNVAAYQPNGDYNLYNSGTYSGGINIGNNKLALNNGTLTFGNAFWHPVAIVDLNRNDNKAQRLLGNAYAEITPIKGLKFTSKFGVDYINNYEDQYNHPRLIGNGIRYNGLAQVIFTDRTIWNWSNFATYSTSFNRHSLAVTGGIESQFERVQITTLSVINFADAFYNTIINGVYTNVDPVSGQTLSVNGGRQLSRGFQGLFARATYDFAKRYYAEAAFRADESSDFGLDAGKGLFPSASVGWRISDENFMSNVSFVNDLKLRGSYGVVGNSDIGFYAAQTLYGGGQYANLNGFTNLQVGNSKLRWEKSKKLDIGFDATILKSRINVVFDYFNSNISDLVLNAPVVLTSGIPNASITTNIGSMKNTGVELTINSTNVSKNDFTWTTSFNFTRVKNKITQLTNAGDVDGGTGGGTFFVATVGRPIATYKLIRSAGVDPATGNAMFFDKDGNIKVFVPETNTYTTQAGAATTPITGADAVYLDKAGYPTWFGGLDNTFRYKNLELGIFLQYSGGNYIYSVTRSGMMTNFMSNNLAEIKERWRKPGDVTTVPRLYWGNNTPNQTSDRWLEKGDYLRARLISLAYNFPRSILQKIGNIDQLRFYINVQNAFTVTGYSGYDPEVNTNRNTQLANVNANIAYGLDNRSTPQARTIIMGINVSF